jgi:predicted AAA+ superfamily ATPase
MRSRARFLQPADGSHFLFGPRGTGKSTWLREHYPDALFIDLLNPTLARELSTRPEDLVALIDGEPERRPVVIDEIQRVPDLLSVVHRLIEERRGLTFVLHPHRVERPEDPSGRRRSTRGTRVLYPDQPLVPLAGTE